MKATQSKTKRITSDGALEIGAAVFILLAPSILSFFKSCGLYVMFAAAGAFLCVRTVSKGHLWADANTRIAAAMGLCSLVWFAFAKNMYGHVRTVFLIFTAVEIMLLAADYFQLEAEKKIGGRLAYMVVFSALILAAVNIINWIFVLKLSWSEPFAAGIGQKDLLGIFMFAALWCAIGIYLNNRKKNRCFLFLCIPLVFVLIMSKSYLTWFFGSIFAAIYLWKRKYRAYSALLALLGMAGGVCFAFTGGKISNAALLDSIGSVFAYPLGLGGGGFISMQGALQSKFYNVEALGTGGELVSSFGIVGAVAVIIFVGYQVYLTFKHRDWFNAFAALLTVYAFFAETSESGIGVLILMCVCVYASRHNQAALKIKVSPFAATAMCVILGAASIYGCVLCVSDGVKNSAYTYMLTDSEKAAARFSAAANINALDGESCRCGAAALRYMYEENGEKESFVRAKYEIERAIRRNKNNAFYYAEYARLLADGQEYESAAEQAENAIALAPLNDEFKVLLSENLCKTMQTLPRGSVEAQRCYMRILECGELVESLENKKIINDYADKAQPYTRIDFYENEENEEETEQ